MISEEGTSFALVRTEILGREVLVLYELNEEMRMAISWRAWGMTPTTDIQNHEIKVYEASMTQDQIREEAARKQTAEELLTSASIEKSKMYLNNAEMTLVALLETYWSYRTASTPEPYVRMDNRRRPSRAVYVDTSLFPTSYRFETPTSTPRRHKSRQQQNIVRGISSITVRQDIFQPDEILEEQARDVSMMSVETQDSREERTRRLIGWRDAIQAWTDQEPLAASTLELDNPATPSIFTMRRNLQNYPPLPVTNRRPSVITRTPRGREATSSPEASQPESTNQTAGTRSLYVTARDTWERSLVKQEIKVEQQDPEEAVAADPDQDQQVPDGAAAADPDQDQTNTPRTKKGSRDSDVVRAERVLNLGRRQAARNAGKLGRGKLFIRAKKVGSRIN